MDFKELALTSGLAVSLMAVSSAIQAQSARDQINIVSSSTEVSMTVPGKLFSGPSASFNPPVLRWYRCKAVPNSHKQ